MTGELLLYGLNVTILAHSPHALSRDDDAFTTEVRRQLEKHGVELHTGVTVRAIEASQVEGVPCEMVVLGAGFQPNVQLAAEAGIQIGSTGAIRTDERR